MELVIIGLAIALIALGIYVGHLAGKVDDARSDTKVIAGVVGIESDPVTFQLKALRTDSTLKAQIDVLRERLRELDRDVLGDFARNQPSLRQRITDAHDKIDAANNRIRALADHADVEFSRGLGHVTCRPKAHIWLTDDASGGVFAEHNGTGTGAYIKSDGSGIAVTATQTPKPKAKRRRKPAPKASAPTAATKLVVNDDALRPTRKGGKR